jgi:CHAT domain-containing protein
VAVAIGARSQGTGKTRTGVVAYGESVKTLQSLRNDLVAIAPDLQFSFRESVEPVYRERVALLLQPKTDIKPSQDNLKQALETIEALQVAELDNLFCESCLETKQKPIELLVLSACQTALGDDRATLGLAGVAVRAGARSTLASLWSVDDAATALLMSRFYQYLAENPNLTKAEALQRAQISLLEHRIFRRPSYWAAFVLVGNWQ